MDNKTDIKKGLKALKDMYKQLGGEKRVSFMGNTVSVIGKNIEVTDMTVYYNNDNTIDEIHNKYESETYKNNTIIKHEYENGMQVRRHIIDATNKGIRKKGDTGTKTIEHTILNDLQVIFTFSKILSLDTYISKYIERYIDKIRKKCVLQEAYYISEENRYLLLFKHRNGTIYGIEYIHGDDLCLSITENSKIVVLINRYKNLKFSNEYVFYNNREVNYRLSIDNNGELTVDTRTFTKYNNKGRVLINVINNYLSGTIDIIENYYDKNNRIESYSKRFVMKDTFDVEFIYNKREYKFGAHSITKTMIDLSKVICRSLPTSVLRGADDNLKDALPSFGSKNRILLEDGYDIVIINEEYENGDKEKRIEKHWNYNGQLCSLIVTEAAPKEFRFSVILPVVFVESNNNGAKIYNLKMSGTMKYKELDIEAVSYVYETVNEKYVYSKSFDNNPHSPIVYEVQKFFFDDADEIWMLDSVSKLSCLTSNDMDNLITRELSTKHRDYINQLLVDLISNYLDTYHDKGEIEWEFKKKRSKEK